MPEKMTGKGKTAAVICELNPLHKGHEAFFRRVKEHADRLVCVLSGNFVQRGEPAILDKWARCRLALKAGADLVIELPLPWACAGAEQFAAGGVRLAAALGNVDYLAFGSEFPDISQLQQIAEALLSEKFTEVFSAENAFAPNSGESFARRRETALSALLGEEVLPVLRSPNAILGIEYLKALLREQSNIVPLVFPRVGAGHDRAAKEGEFVSAGELRERLRTGNSLDGLVPDYTLAVLEKERDGGRCPADVSYLERAILCKLRAMRPADFAALPDISEGLEHRLFDGAKRAGSLEEFYTLVKSKRYSHARIRRLTMYAFLGVTKGLPPLPPYLRILGMTDAGAELLQSVSPSLPLAARAGDFQKLGREVLRLFQLEAAADDLYALACPAPQPCGRDFTEKLLRI